jgi:hypothetical protein
MKRRKFLQLLGIASLLPALGITVKAQEQPIDVSWWQNLHAQLKRARLVDGLPCWEHYKTVAEFKRRGEFARAETLLLRILAAEKVNARVEFAILSAEAQASPDSLKKLNAYKDMLWNGNGRNTRLDLMCVSPISPTGAPAPWRELAVLYSKQKKYDSERRILEQYIRIDRECTQDLSSRMDGTTARALYKRYGKLMKKRFPGEPILEEGKIYEAENFVWDPSIYLNA